MKNILFITTGGTIASTEQTEGYTPTMGADELLAAVPALENLCTVDMLPLMSIDSSNMQPEDWLTIAEAISRTHEQHDGVVIAHGTDTMAYTAAALSFLLLGLKQPVILTGSMIAMGEPGSDAPTNIYDAFQAATAEISGVYIAFGGRLIAGVRASKISTTDFQAFGSINRPEAAVIDVAGVHGYSLRLTSAGGHDPDNIILCPDVLLLKLVPGTKPELLSAIGDLGYRGLVIEAFGSGGVPFESRNLLPELESLIQRGVAVVVTSQCPFGRSDLTIYEVGLKALRLGVIPGHDMTTETLVTKLMWALGRTDDLEVVTTIMSTPYAGETTNGYN